MRTDRYSQRKFGESTAFGDLMRRLVITLLLLAAAPAPALAEFPWKGGGAVPSDLSGKEVWMYAATPEPGNEPVNSSPRELGGVRGSRLVDAPGVETAWQVTTGRPDVLIAVLDSGIRWDDEGAMRDLRRKTWLERAELPAPRADRADSLDAEVECAELQADGRHDADGDGALTVTDYACDGRVERDPAARAGRGQPRGNGPAALLDPQDLLIAFSDGVDDDEDGFVDEIVGWDFLDDDNDPFDDVSYGHGTGEAKDSVAEAANGQSGVGTCPDCMAMHIRVGDSFVADVNRFAQGVLFSVDQGAKVVQEALGALNNSKLARQAVRYAYEHGVVTIASAADEAAQHHHWPMSYPGVIVVNSVTRYDEFTPVPKSYLQFNGCTNFSSKISVAIPSVSCSSDATGRAAGMAGLLYSAGRDAGRELSANEVRQLFEQHAEDVNFAATEVSCRPVAIPGCTDPMTNAPGGPFAAVLSPLATSRRYPAREGFDQFYGYGRANMAPAVRAARDGRVPPQVEIVSPEWFDNADPADRAVAVRAEIDARGRDYVCEVLVAPGSYPGDGRDFARVDSDWCDGATTRSTAVDGRSMLASVDVAALRAAFPATAGDFTGREPGLGEQMQSGRPNSEPYGFTVKVVARAAGVTGMDRRNLYLHRDADLLPGWPKRIGDEVAGDVESSPLLTDLDGDGADELVVAGSDGLVHALRRDGSQPKGWPAAVDRLPLHAGQPAFRSGAVDDDARGAVLASVASGDLDRDGEPEVIVADLEGKVYAFRGDGRRAWKREAEPDFSGRPLSPFVSERRGERHRVQHGFIASPVIADLDADGRQEVVAASMDRHVYAWDHRGRPVDGFPAIVVDPSKVDSIDPRSHRVEFRAGIASLMQGAIIDTPAVGDLTGDGRPEIVVGTNEEYREAINASAINTAALNMIGRAGAGLADNNSRVYALKPTGGDLAKGENPFVDGWPFKVGRLFAELLPIVGEGITGAPVIGEVDCPSGGRGPKVGVVPDGGPAYVVNANATSCLGTDPEGRSIAMQSDVPEGNPLRGDALVFPAVGHPAFGDVGGGTSLIVPTTGVVRALDLAVNEYQGGEDSYSAWNPATGRFRPGWPARVNDLSFLTGPSVGDIDGLPGEEILGGTAHLDLQAFSGAGKPAGAAWPKLTSDWMVANPLLGDLGGTGDRIVVAAVRDGRIFAYRTGADACAPASWPRFHHDDANSGDARRDAESPGRPAGARIEGGRLTFTAPGDDGGCGRATAYEVLSSDAEPDGASDGWRPVSGAPAAAGSSDAVALPGEDEWVAVRAVDEQGNVSRPAVVKR